MNPNSKPDFDPNYFHNMHHHLQERLFEGLPLLLPHQQQLDGVFLGDHRLNSNPNFYYNHHQQQDGVFLGDHRLNPNPNYYYNHHQQQEGLSWGGYHINPKSRDYQIQPKRQRLWSDWAGSSPSYEEAGEINDGVYLGDYRLNPGTNYYHRHQHQQDGVFWGDHRLKPDTNYYHHHHQQEGVNLGDYHMNPKPEYCPNQQQPKRQRHSAWDRYSRSYEEAGEISENVYGGGYNTNPRRNYYYHKQQHPPRPWKPFFPSPISLEQTISEEESFHPFGVGVARFIADGTKRFESGLAFSRPATVEEMLTYNREVKESDGFDVTDLPDVCLAGSISPIGISNEYCRNICETVAQTAIAAFNAKYERSKGALKLEKLVKAMCQGAGGIKYYLTFDATNVAKKSTKTYQAKVLGPVRGNEVTGFRRQGSKKWYWNNSCCG